MNKIKQWFISHKPSKRRVMQLYAALLFNANLKGFGNGRIYQGPLKNICTPGLNCYSCPGASGACPLGALQNAIASSNKSLPYYVFGILILYGFLFGRWICGFLCPFGLIQDLLHKIKTPKLKKGRITRVLSYLKYVILVIFVGIFPLMYMFKDLPLPGFCKYICPAGTIEGAVGLLSNKVNEEMLSMLGPLFTWKFVLLVGFIVGCVFIYRFFCRFFCPLGALYGLFNKIALVGVKLDKPKCIDCGRCVGVCKMDISHVGDHECINCGECMSVCHTNAIVWKGGKFFLPPNEVGSGIDDGKAEEKDKPNLDKIKKRNKISRIIVGASLALLLAGALVYYNFIDKVPGAETEGPSQGNSIGEMCYSADVSLYGGETFNLEDTRGKVTVISFWGAWNEPSLELLADLDKIKGELGDTVSVVAIHSNYESEGVESFISENYPDSAILFGHDDEKESYFDLLGGSVTYPLTFVIDEEGIITARYESAVSYEDLSRDVRVALNVPGNMVGDRCYTADIELIGGGMHNLEDTKGRITVINFWGTWCGPCVAELPHFDEIASEYGDKVAVIAIHTDYGNDKAPAFIEEKYPESSIMFGVDKGEEYYKRLGGKGTYPMTVIVDEDGIVVAKYVSSVTYDMLKDAIDSALAD